MADENLNSPVIIQASRIDATLLPDVFSQSYRLYVIQQGSDLGAVAGKANEAGEGAYSAQQKNEQQDLTLADHDERITALGGRVSDAEQDISSLQAGQESLDDRTGQAEENIGELQANTVSKVVTVAQSLASPLGVTTSLSVNGTKVIGIQQTGFTATTGTALKGTFNADTSYTVAATYTQSQVQAIGNDLRSARQRIKALEDAMRAHGLIN